MLCVGVMVAYFDRVNLSIALASPEFKAFFRLTDDQRGALNSAFFWSYALLQIPAGWFTDRFGVKYPYASVSLYGACCRPPRLWPGPSGNCSHCARCWEWPRPW